MRAPRVCIVCYNPARFTTRVDRCARTLAEAGWEVVVVAVAEGCADETEQRAGYLVRRVGLRTRALPRGGGLKLLRFAEGIWRTFLAAWREDADVYDARDAYPLLATHLAAALRGAKVVYSSDELNLDRNWSPSADPVWRWWMLRYERFFARRSAAVVTSDEGRARVLHQRYAVSPVVVHNVPDLAEAPVPDLDFRRDALGDGRVLLVYQGLLAENRGLPELLSALDELPECRLAIIGYGPLEAELAARIAAGEGSGRARLYPAMEFERLMRATAACDIGVAPILGTCLSYRLAAPNKLFEYLAAGLPVVVTDLEEMGRYVRELRAGALIAEPVTAEGIVAAVRAVIDGPEPLREIGARNRRAAFAHYTWARERDTLLSAYARVPVRAGVRHG